MTGEAHLRVVILRTEHDIGDVAQANQISFVFADNELFEIGRRVQIGVGGKIDLQERTFGAADGREIIVSGKRAAYLRRAYIQSRHPVRLHPNAHREGASAKDVGLLHTTERGQARLHQTHQIIGHLVRLKNV